MEIQNVPNFILKTDGKDSVVFDTSLVANPATGANFIAFSDETPTQKLGFQAVERYERIVSGIWFAPDTRYLRYDEFGVPYTVSIGAADLLEALKQHLKSGSANTHSANHWDYLNAYALEYWVWEGENTKSPIYGITAQDLGLDPAEIKLGTIFKSVFIVDELFFQNKILSGEVKGFSIEGVFQLELQDVSAALTVESDVLPVDLTPEPSPEPAMPIKNIVLSEEVAAEIEGLKLLFSTQIESIKAEFSAMLEQKNAEVASLKEDLEAQTAKNQTLIEKFESAPIQKTTQSTQPIIGDKKTTTKTIGGKTFTFSE